MEEKDIKNNFPQLRSIIIGTSNMERAKNFYTSVFGVVIENDESSHYVSAHLSDGNHIELEGNSENRFSNWVKHNVGTYKNTEFFVPDINLFFQTVEENGGTIITKPVPRPWGGFGGEIADPDGNIIAISQK